MDELAGIISGLVIVALGAWILPRAMLRAFLPTLASSKLLSATNYRGRRIVLGLGLVWLFWAIGLLLGRLLMRFLLEAFSSSSALVSFEGVTEIMPVALVLGVLVLGLVDDVAGSDGEKGFRGHLTALRTGRLTTGGLKLLGIGLLAMASVQPAALGSRPSWWAAIGIWVLQVLAIALSANLVNLTDLRPGRALKLYSLLAAACVALIGSFSDGWTALGMAVALFGPVAAVWRFDLGETGMLGDAGANAAGALAGWFLAILLPWWALAIYVAVVLSLNLVSERRSFSAVIERNRVLSWVDRLGRRADG